MQALVHLRPETKPETDAIRHYITVGWKKQFDVHPLFKSEYYLSQAGDVQIVYFYIRPLLEVESYVKQRMRTVFLDMSNPKVMQ
jgi:hypothetical protein